MVILTYNPSTQRLRQKDLESKAILDYGMGSCLKKPLGSHDKGKAHMGDIGTGRKPKILKPLMSPLQRS
jgi:hypothetical protein